MNFYTENSDKKNARVAILWSLFVFWLTLSGVALWYFQTQDYRSYSTSKLVKQAFFSNPQKLNLPLALSAALDKQINAGAEMAVVHFWNPSCSCNRFNLPHLETIVADNTGKNIGFVVATVTEENAKDIALPKDRKIFSSLDVIALSKEKLASGSIPEVSPAAAIFDKNKNLIYMGPYGNGAFCQTSDEGYVESILNKSSRFSKIREDILNVRGCFCAWS